MTVLSDIRQIDLGILVKPASSRALSAKSVAKRMSWAARRSTSREEDRAYSLLGLFNINMPLLYREGPKAFQRLQEEIIRQSPFVDHSILARLPWHELPKKDGTILAKWRGEGRSDVLDGINDLCDGRPDKDSASETMLLCI